MVQLQHFNRSIPFYMILSDTCAFVNKVAGSGGHAPAGGQSALHPHDVHRSGSQGSAIIIDSSGRQSIFLKTPGNRT